jgi:methionyl-tRNA formyltransferase
MKKIIIFAQRDFIFTYKILNSIVNEFNNYDVYLKLGNSNFFRKIKVILCIFLFSGIKELIPLLKFEKLSKKFKITNDIESQNFDFGICLNYPKKISLQSFNIYNFHLGNLKNQRGSFIFFYKFLNKWDKISLTLHKITNEFDKGDIIKEKEFDCKNMNSIQILNLYNKNIDFIKRGIDIIKNNNYISYSVIHDKAYTQPTFYEIIKHRFNIRKNEIE